MDMRDVWESMVFRRRRIIPAAVAVAVAVAVWASIQILFFGQGPNAAAPSPPVQQVAVAEPPQPAPVAPEATAQDIVFPKVLVPNRDIQAGVTLTPDLVEWREWRQEFDPDMTILQNAKTNDSVFGSIVRKPYTAGTPVTWDGITSPLGPGFLGVVLRPEMRAVTVEVDRATTEANIIHPGDQVDVILVSANEGANVAAQVIVRKTRVLAVGSTLVSMVRQGPQRLFDSIGLEERQPTPGGTFTLEVSAVDAKRIALAASAGRLTLAMRSVAAPSDEGPLPPPVRFRDVIMEPEPPPAIESKPPVRIIRGGAGGETVEIES